MHTFFQLLDNLNGCFVKIASDNEIADCSRTKVHIEIMLERRGTRLFNITVFTRLLDDLVYKTTP